MEPLGKISLTDQAIEAIKRWILTHHLQEGDQLPSERRLCEILGISRSILREALSALVSQHIVVKVPGKGAFVGDFDRCGLGVHIWLTLTDQAELGTLCDLRDILEIGALELVAQRATGEELDELELQVRDMEQRLSRGERINELDTEFHLALFRAAHVPALLDLYEQVLRDSITVSISQNPRARAVLTPDIGTSNLALLHRVLDGLRSGNTCEAQQAMKSHISMPHELMSQAA
jgi:GntR family transcriptional repressor for pyruvate dehydrogenase complex